jgi:hypothetical protein
MTNRFTPQLRIGLSLAMVFVVALAILSPMPSAAQQFYGSVVGTVTDTSGAVIPGATVTITSKSTGEKHSATSNAAGDYQFVDLVPAVYSIAVEKANFKRYFSDSIRVDVNQTVRVNAPLQIGAATETVQVSMGETVELQTDSGAVTNKVEAQQMDELPIAGRNVMQLLTVTAGVMTNTAVEAGATLSQNGGTSSNPKSFGGGSNVYTINGGDNEEYLDGAPINMLQGSNVGLMPTGDDIQEFSVDTSAGDSSEGRATGGVINFTSKSGSNAFHGSMYDYFHNTDLNANNYFSNQQGLARAELNENQWGFNVGFPIKRDKIFFFGTYENDEKNTSTPVFANVPTNGNAFSSGLPGGGGINLYNGIFSRAITDPIWTNYGSKGLTAPGGVGANGGAGCQTVAGTQPIASNSQTPYTGNNIIYDAVQGTYTVGQGCWDSTANILRSFWAQQPNSTLSGTNFAVNMPASDKAPQMNARVDINISPKQRLFAHTAWWAPLDTPLKIFPHPNVTSLLPNNTPWNLGAQVGGFNTNLYILGDTYTFNPKTVLDLRAEWVRFRFSKLVGVNNFNLGGLGSNWASLMYTEPKGAQYLPGPTMGAGGQVHNLLPTAGLPFTSGSANSFATTGSGQQWDNYGLNGTLTRVFGKHSMKIGFEAREMDMEVLATGFNPGNPTFGNKYTGDEWADFLMGDFVGATFGGSYGGTEFNYYQAYFVTDTWQLTPKLTLNLGLRYELPGGLYEKKNHTLVFLPKTTDPVSGAYGTEQLVASSASPSRSTTPVKHDDFGPRVGFAYRLDNKTVVRGGFGISQMAVDLDGGGNGAPGTAVTSSSLSWTNPTGGSSVPTAQLSNPIPTSAIYIPAQFRSNANFLQTLAQAAQTGGGTGLSGNYLNERLPYFEEYNFALQRQFGNSFQATVSYVGSHGLELNAGTAVDQIPYSAYTVSGAGSSEVAVAASGPYAGTNLTTTITNNQTIYTPNGSGTNIQTASKGVYCTPGYTSPTGNATFNGFCNANWKVGQTLQPYPNYKSATINNLTYGNQHYNALQATTTWRIPGGGLVGSAFTWAKTIGDNVNYQDYNNHRGDRTVEGIPSRLVVNFNYPLPIGQGQRFLNTGNAAANVIISGWAINDVTSFQHGGYLSITSNSQNNFQANFGGGTSRASYNPSLPGCGGQKTIGGAAVAKVKNGQWFNPNCFVGVGSGGQNNSALAPFALGPYDFGTENANDPKLFAQGIDNSDISLSKTTKVAEKFNVIFRMETFNTFNRFQAGSPNTSAGNGSFGKVTTQANNPRQVQLSLRVSY